VALANASALSIHRADRGDASAPITKPGKPGLTISFVAPVTRRVLTLTDTQARAVAEDVEAKIAADEIAEAQ